VHKNQTVAKNHFFFQCFWCKDGWYGRENKNGIWNGWYEKEKD